MGRFSRPAWPTSGGDDYERYRREKFLEWMQADAAPPPNPWPQDVLHAVEVIREVADSPAYSADVGPEVLVARLARSAAGIVAYVEPVYLQVENERRSGQRELHGGEPWYFEPSVPTHVMRFEGATAFRRWAEGHQYSKITEAISSLHALLVAAYSLVELGDERDHAESNETQSLVELASDFIRTWEVARHP